MIDRVEIIREDIEGKWVHKLGKLGLEGWLRFG